MTQRMDPAPRRFRLPWALVPVFLLLASALGVGGMAIVAVHDPNFATEPDYYQKAVHWDRTQAQAAENQRLNYRVSLPKVVVFDARGQATIELTLSDHAGLPLLGAQVSAEAFANAYSADIVQLSFHERAPGIYCANLPVRHRGLWVFRLSARTATQHFTTDVRATLLPGSAA